MWAWAEVAPVASSRACCRQLRPHIHHPYFPPHPARPRSPDAQPFSPPPLPYPPTENPLPHTTPAVCIVIHTLSATKALPRFPQAFWHSSAHLLGQALELEFGVDLTIGPALEEGFYYDCFMGERNLGEADKARIEKRIEAVGAEPAGS